jgi:uncharacterized protein
MSEQSALETGSIGWVDLTVPDAGLVRDFYQAVIGWKPHEVAMKDAGAEYHDYAMLTPENGKSIAGVCYKRGTNKDLPSCWMIYITVADLDASLKKCVELGGRVAVGPKALGAQAKYAVIEDPSGAACGLFQALDG